VTIDWQPSVYSIEGVVDASIDRAWELMIDYRSYNPTFGEGSPYHVDGDDDAYDLDRARELMGEAGYEDGFEVTIPTRDRSAVSATR
jgi:ABC-type transport system substrate-binding protein